MTKKLISFRAFKSHCGGRNCHLPFYDTCTTKNCKRWARLEAPKPAPQKEPEIWEGPGYNSGG